MAGDEQQRFRAGQYAKFYYQTATVQDYRNAVINALGKEFIAESELVWEALDQYEGMMPVSLQ